MLFELKMTDHAIDSGLQHVTPAVYATLIAMRSQQEDRLASLALYSRVLVWVAIYKEAVLAEAIGQSVGLQAKQLYTGPMYRQ